MVLTLPPDILTLIQHAPEGMFLQSAEAENPGQILARNEAYARLHGYPAGQLTGQGFAVLSGAVPVKGVAQAGVPLPTVTAGREELRLLPAVSSYMVEVARSAVDVQGRLCLLEVARDAETRRALISQLSECALQDALTGLGNRRAFKQDLEWNWPAPRATTLRSPY